MFYILDSKNHWTTVTTDDPNSPQRKTAVEPVYDGQHPYFDEAKQQWTSEPAQAVAPDATAVLAAQVAALTQKVDAGSQQQALLGAQLAQALAAQSKEEATHE